MGFGQSTQTVDGPTDTAAGKAQFEIAKRELDRYRETSGPVLDRIMAKADDRLNADGTAKTDATAARVANEDAFTIDPANADPNRVGTLAELGIEGAKSGVKTEMDLVLGQQENAHVGIDNIAMMGAGRTGESLARQSDLAQQAQTTANADAQMAVDQRAANSQAAGQVIGGLGALAYGSMNKAPAANPMSLNRLNAQGMRGV